jgi:hypothetical protein
MKDGFKKGNKGDIEEIGYKKAIPPFGRNV